LLRGIPRFFRSISDRIDENEAILCGDVPMSDTGFIARNPLLSSTRRRNLEGQIKKLSFGLLHLLFASAKRMDALTPSSLVAQMSMANARHRVSAAGGFLQRSII